MRELAKRVVASDAFAVMAPAPEAVRVCLGGAADREMAALQPERDARNR